jgi:5-methyltetrahydropteroyltriglutamate--homocysteine methyltransferase
MLFPTSLVGSYCQPDWLIDRDKLKGQFPPRTRAKELWRIPEDRLQQAQDDATLIAIRDQERAGLDILTDGEIRRESYSNRFATALDGLDLDNYAEVMTRSGKPVPVPRITGPIRRTGPIEVEDLKFLRANTDRQIKITLPGPFTMSQQAVNEYYPTVADAAMDYARAVREEMAELFAAGADVVQLDEPWMQAKPDLAEQYGLAALNAALEGAAGKTAVHICFGYAALTKDRPDGYSFLPQMKDCLCDQISIETAQANLDTSVLEEVRGKTIILGVLNLADMGIETPEIIAHRIRRALPHVDADKVVVAPDCGLKYLPRDVAFGKMKAMADGAAIVRAELGG